MQPVKNSKKAGWTGDIGEAEPVHVLLWL